MTILTISLFVLSTIVGFALRERAQRRVAKWEAAYRWAHSEQAQVISENVYAVTRAMLRVTREGDE